MKIHFHSQLNDTVFDEKNLEANYDKIALMIHEFEYYYPKASYYELSLTIDDRELSINSKSVGKSKKSIDVINLEVSAKIKSIYKFLKESIEGTEIKDEDYNFEKKKPAKKAEETNN